MAVPVENRRYTVREYLDLEAKALDKHEYDNGEILAMAGCTLEHDKVNRNLYTELGARLKGSPCSFHTSNMRIRLDRSGRYVYPDATIVCGEARFDSDDPNRTTITNPRIVFEILSETTEAYDRGNKFEAYRTLDSFQMYVLISQVRPIVETFTRVDDGTWIFAAYHHASAVAKLPVIGIDLPLQDLYTGVQFPELLPPPPEESGEPQVPRRN